MERKIGCCGRQRIQVKRKGKVTFDSGFQNNLVLDNFFNKLTSPTVSFVRAGTYAKVMVGAGTTPPVNTDTEIESLIFQRDFNGIGEALEPEYNAVDDTYDCVYHREFAFTEGEVVGNVSELGTVFGASYSDDDTLDTRALVKDSSGNPTTLVVTAEDQLIFTHEFVMKYPGQITTGTFDIGGTTHTWKYALVNKTSYYTKAKVSDPQEIAVRRWGTGSTRYCGVTISPALTVGYDYGTYSIPERDNTFFTGFSIEETNDVMTSVINFWYAASSANVNDSIGAICLGNSETRTDRVPFIITFDPPIPKGNQYKFTLTMTTTFTRA